MTYNHKLIKENVQPKELPFLSPSSINLYIQDPALWVLKHFYGSTSGFNIHAMRGVALEDGLNHYLELKEKAVNIDEAYAKGLECAKDRFDGMAFFSGDEETLQKIEEVYEDWFFQIVTAFEHEFHQIPGQQKKITTEICGLPIRGIIDYNFDESNPPWEKGLQTDLKTCTKIPKVCTRGPRKGFLEASKKANVRQQAIYNKATDVETSLLFVSPEGSLHHVLSKEELEEAMEVVIVTCNEIKELLSLPIEEVLTKTVPKWKTMKWSFYWDEGLRKMADVLWEDYAETKEEDGY